jgi:hypothetical protein
MMKAIGMVTIVAAVLWAADSGWAQCVRGGGRQTGAPIGPPAILVNADFYWGPQTYAGQLSNAQSQMIRQRGMQLAMMQRAAAAQAKQEREMHREQQRLATRRLQREQAMAEREARRRGENFSGEEALPVAASRDRRAPNPFLTPPVSTPPVSTPPVSTPPVSTERTPPASSKPPTGLAGVIRGGR